MILRDTFDDLLLQFKDALPSGWFRDQTPIIESLCHGITTSNFAVYQALQEVVPQFRLRTASGGILDMFSGDFFGDSLLRLNNETDDDYRGRILAELFKELATKKAMQRGVGHFTGVIPAIYEYGQPIDPLGFVLSTNPQITPAANYGTIVKGHHAFIVVYQIGVTPGSSGIGGYNSSVWGYGEGRGAYNQLPVVSESLLALINAIKPVGTTIWVKIVRGSAETLQQVYNAVLMDDSTITVSKYGGIVTDSKGIILTDTTYEGE